METKTKNKMGLSEIETGKLPPQAIDAEESLIGCLLTIPDGYLQIAGIVKSESFYKTEHQYIFRAISELAEKHTPVDLVTVTQYLKGKNQLDLVGGVVSLTQLSVNRSFSYNFEHHAKIIQQKFIQRELVRIGLEISKRAYDESVDLVEHLSYAQSEIENVDRFTTNEGESTIEVATEAISEIEQECKAVSSGEVSGVPCGLSELNKAIGGWKKRAFILLGARPGEGKTTHALNFAITAAKAGLWVNFYSYEMGSTDLFKIMLAGESEVNRSRIRDGRLDENDWSLINMSLGKIDNLPILWYDSPDIGISQIRANTRKNIIKGQCDLVVIDYIQLMPIEDKKANREGQISDISRKIKRTAKANNIPVIALAQLNREVEKRASPEVFNSDLRESGSLEQDADLIMFLFSTKNEQNEPEQRFIKISKHRNGVVGTFEYKVNQQMTKIFDAEMPGDEMIDYSSHFEKENEVF